MHKPKRILENKTHITFPRTLKTPNGSPNPGWKTSPNTRSTRIKDLVNFQWTTAKRIKENDIIEK